MARAQTLRRWRRHWREDQRAPRAAAGATTVIAALALVMAAAGVSGWFTGLILTRPTPQDAAPSPDEYRIGTITYVPVKGATCEVHRFDNFTGAVVPDGFVNCERKLNPEVDDPMGPGTQRSARMKAILDNFKK